VLLLPSLAEINVMFLVVGDAYTRAYVCLPALHINAKQSFCLKVVMGPVSLNMQIYRRCIIARRFVRDASVAWSVVILPWPE
jgi:hypothetical protein